MKIHWHSLLTATAALFSLGVMLTLVKTNVDLAQNLRDVRVDGDETRVPAAGTLAGRKLADGSEWMPADAGGELGVLVAITDSRVAGAEFWSDVAARLLLKVPSAQIVGLCIGDDSCDAAIEPRGVLTLLNAADPALMHALTAARDDRLFVLRGRRIVASITLLEDSERLVQRILAYAGQSMTGAGK